MQLPRRVTPRTAILLLCAFIVVGGFTLSLISNGIFGSAATFGPSHSPNQTYPVGQNNSSYTFAGAAASAGLLNQGAPVDGTEVIQTSTEMSTTVNTPGTTVIKGSGESSSPTSALASTTLGTGAEVAFFSQVSLSCSSPQKTAAGVVALAYTVGGYVAYQSTSKDSAYVVIRVPETTYPSVVAQVEGMGNVSRLASNSSDVSVQYTDYNATLASLLTEQSALLKLLNQSTTINTTIAIENQLQGVDQQINDVQGQILQTKTLIDFATIEVTISKIAETVPLSITLTSIPLNGTAPLSVTFNAIVKGGAQPYVVNYNFGDGTADQGQILIHTYDAAGNYKVTVTATDQNGTVATAYATIRVAAAPSQLGVVNFPTLIANLFVNVVEGIAEVAVVVLPLAAVGAIVVIPLRRRIRTQKGIKQSP